MTLMPFNGDKLMEYRLDVENMHSQNSGYVVSKPA